MPRSRANIANAALRIFLQEMGAAYDAERGLPAFGGRAHFAEVTAFFDGRCCYCREELGPAVRPTKALIGAKVRRALARA